MDVYSIYPNFVPNVADDFELQPISEGTIEQAEQLNALLKLYEVSDKELRFNWERYVATPSLIIAVPNEAYCIGSILGQYPKYYYGETMGRNGCVFLCKKRFTLKSTSPATKYNHADLVISIPCIPRHLWKTVYLFDDRYRIVPLQNPNPIVNEATQLK